MVGFSSLCSASPRNAKTGTARPNGESRPVTRAALIPRRRGQNHVAVEQRGQRRVVGGNVAFDRTA